jgi:hypothetical protein
MLLFLWFLLKAIILTNNLFRTLNTKTLTHQQRVTSNQQLKKAPDFSDAFSLLTFV